MKTEILYRISKKARENKEKRKELSYLFTRVRDDKELGYIIVPVDQYETWIDGKLMSISVD